MSFYSCIYNILYFQVFILAYPNSHVVHVLFIEGNHYGRRYLQSPVDASAGTFISRVTSGLNLTSQQFKL